MVVKLTRQPASHRKKGSYPLRSSPALFLLVLISFSASITISSRSPRTQTRASPGEGISSQAEFPEAPLEEAYFQFNYPPYSQTFTFKLTDSQKIQMAREILNGMRPNRHVMGAIIKQPAAYNSPWSYHLDPETVTFFDFATEICDATIQYVEDHLDEACGSFLPNCTWCPQGSRLLAEVSPQPTATPTPPAPSSLIYLPFVVHLSSK